MSIVGLVGIAAVVIVLFLGFVAFVLAPECSEGGNHDFLLLGRAHGRYTAKWTNGDHITVSGYVELKECRKCKRRRAVRWTDCTDAEFGGRQSVDVSYAEEQLRKAGILGKPPTQT